MRSEACGRRFRRPAASALLAAALVLSGCEFTESGPAESDRVVTVLLIDISGSTRDLRLPGGSFEGAALETATQTAINRGTLWATVVDESTVSHSLWEIDGHDFTPSVPENETLAQAELKRQAAKLKPELVKLVRRGGAHGSDLLGGLEMASRLFADYPKRPRALVFLTDGGINVPGLRLTRLTSLARINKAIKRLKRDHRLPDLTGGSGSLVRVWLGGLGHGLRRESVSTVIALWQRLVPAAGGRLVSDDTTLRLVGFPRG